MSVRVDDPTQGTPVGSGLESAAPTVVVPNDRAKQRFGRYLVKAFHARGGMGEVWLSSDSSLGREVALKVLRRENDAVRARFVAEAQITGQLEHPGIVPIHDFGIDESGQPYYVMKFVRGRTLKQAIAEYHAIHGTAMRDGTRELQFVRLLRAFIDVCHAVAYAHSRGVFHRDIKPDNVMIGPYGETMLLDWGISKLSEPAAGHIHCDAWNNSLGDSGGSDGPSNTAGLSSPTSSHTCEGTVLGSPSYMSPEMAEGRSGDCDQRTDVFLLGATLFEILTGKLPRQGTSRDELIELARTAPPPPARLVTSDCPRPLEAIAMKAMAYRREDRYGRAMELAEDVERYVAGEAVVACPESTLRRAWRWCRKHRRGLARGVVIAALVTVITAAAVAWRQARELREREQAADDLNQFLSLADEARFYAANKDAPGEQALYYDSERGEQAATFALNLADRWGTNLQRWPLPQSLPRFRSELSDLLILTARERAARNSEAAKASILLLDRARDLGDSSSQGYHAVRAECLDLAGDARAAAAERQAATAAPATAEDWFLRGEQLRTGDASGKSDVAGALQAYRAALQARPNHFWAAFQLGRCYIQLGRYAEAASELGTCVALRPNEPWGYCARGVCLALLKQYPDAGRDFDSALTARPGFGPARLQKGVVLWLQKQNEEALDCFNQLLQPGEPELVEAAYYRGQVRLDRGDYAAAVSDFNRFLANRPEFDSAYLLRARAHLLLGQTDQCLRDLDGPPTAHTDSPIDARSATVMSRRAHLLRQCAVSWPAPANRQAAELARTLLSELVRSGETSAQTLGDLGAVTARLGQPQPAVVLFSQALDESPTDPLLLKLRGQTLVALKHYSDARGDFSRVVALDPSDGSAHSWLAYIAALEGATDPSDEAARALAVSPDDFEVYHNVACVYAQLSRNNQAKADEYQGVAVAFLRRAVQLWRNRLTGPDEIQLIRSEPAFAIPSLQQRADYQRLLQPSS